MKYIAPCEQLVARRRAEPPLRFTETEGNYVSARVLNTSFCRAPHHIGSIARARRVCV